MNKWPRDNAQALKDFYGDPGEDEVAPQLVKVVPPFKFYYEGRPVKTISFHKKAAPALERALEKIWDYYGQDQDKIDALEISKFSGTYNHRMVRGSSTKWSNHAFGAAIDIDAEDNGFGTGRGDLPWPVIAAFKSEGAAWGGDYKGRTDPMHFEFCNRGEPQRTFEQWLDHYGVKSKGASKRAEPVGMELDDDDDVPLPRSRPKQQAPHGKQSDQIEDVQRRLRAIGYFEVGEVDGRWGSMTAAGIAAFKNDRKCPGPPLIDLTLLAELQKAEDEGWKRPIAKSRAEAKPEEVAKKIETVDAAKKSEEASAWSKFLAWLVGIPSGITAVFKGAFDNAEDAAGSPLFSEVKEFFADNIALIAVGLFIISVAIWWKSKQAEQEAERAKRATVEAYQEGRLK